MRWFGWFRKKKSPVVHPLPPQDRSLLQQPRTQPPLLQKKFVGQGYGRRVTDLQKVQDNITNGQRDQQRIVHEADERRRRLQEDEEDDDDNSNNTLLNTVLAVEAVESVIDTTAPDPPNDTPAFEGGGGGESGGGGADIN
jgi:hypothetical protein